MLQHVAVVRQLVPGAAARAVAGDERSIEPHQLGGAHLIAQPFSDHVVQTERTPMQVELEEQGEIEQPGEDVG